METSIDERIRQEHITLVQEMDRAIFGDQSHTPFHRPFYLTVLTDNRYYIGGNPYNFSGKFTDLMECLSVVKDGEGYGSVLAALRILGPDVGVEMNIY